jgi:hypothetical protein
LNKDWGVGALGGWRIGELAHWGVGALGLGLRIWWSRPFGFAVSAAERLSSRRSPPPHQNLLINSVIQSFNHSIIQSLPMRKFGIFLFIIFFTSCQPYRQEQLIGTWQGVEIIEEGQPLDIDPGLIRLTFDNEKHYTYQSTLNYREAGRFSLQSKFLFTTDTINRASSEKAVEILQLTPDSLFLKMSEAGRERIVKLVKIEGR